MSTRPGSRSRPVASTVRTPSVASCSPTAAIRPSRMATSWRRLPSWETTVAPVTTQSKGAGVDIRCPFGSVDRGSGEGELGVLLVHLADRPQLEQVVGGQFQSTRGDGGDVRGGGFVGDGEDLLARFAVADEFVARQTALVGALRVEVQGLAVLGDGEIGGTLRIGENVGPPTDLGLQERLQLGAVVVDVVLGGDVDLTDKGKPTSASSIVLMSNPLARKSTTWLLMNPR